MILIVNINLFKKQKFDVPEGRYRSKVVSMYKAQKRGECSESIKILFAPLALEKKLEQSVVASEYCIDCANEMLVDDLNTILSGGFDTHVDDNGDFDHKAVNERLVDIVVKSFHKGDHERPYTFVSAVLPPDVLHLNQPMSQLASNDNCTP